MSACAACSELIGQAAPAEPHAALKPQSGRKLRYAWHEVYACKACGSMLQRVIPFEDAGKGQAEPWSEVTSTTQ
jgi:hypothetical protein